MDNIEIVISELDNSEHVVIYHGNNAFISMPKSVWEELEAKKLE